MVDWKKRFITGFTVTPVVFLLLHYRLLMTAILQGIMFRNKILTSKVATFLCWSEYRKLVQGIMKLHSSESEHNYINKLASSPVNFFF